MKRILLTSTALIAVAGSAFAAGHAVDHGVSFGGDAELQWNSDKDIGGADGGVSYSVGLTVSASTALDNGLTASLSGDIDIGGHVVTASDSAAGTATVSTGNTFANNNIAMSDVVFSLSSDTASLNFGDTATAGDSNWVSAGDMEADGFSENGDGAEDAILRGDVTAGAMKASVSYGLVGGDLKGVQMAASYNFGSGTVGFAMEDDQNGQDGAMGVYVTTSLGGADITLAYAQDDRAAKAAVAASAAVPASNLTPAKAAVAAAPAVAGGEHTSMGIKVSYPVGDVIVGAYYVSEDGVRGNDDNMGVDVAYTSGALAVSVYYKDKQGDGNYGVDVDYDMGNGLTLKAGADKGDGSSYDGYYVGAAYDLGGGASVSLTHVDAARNTDNTDNEFFGDDDNFGTTLTLGLSF